MSAVSAGGMSAGDRQRLWKHRRHCHPGRADSCRQSPCRRIGHLGGWPKAVLPIALHRTRRTSGRFAAIDRFLPRRTQRTRAQPSNLHCPGDRPRRHRSLRGGAGSTRGYSARGRSASWQRSGIPPTSFTKGDAGGDRRATRQPVPTPACRGYPPPEAFPPPRSPVEQTPWRWACSRSAKSCRS